MQGAIEQFHRKLHHLEGTKRGKKKRRKMMRKEEEESGKEKKRKKRQCEREGREQWRDK